ncbi:MAG: hypothetical protein JWR10_3709 [Rubritepida sp.]|nr:hypothetical protein [Rubritepida sp.]
MNAVDASAGGRFARNQAVLARSTVSRPRFTLLLPIAAVLVPVIMLSGSAWLNWRTAMEDATTQLSHTADAAADYGSRALNAYAVAAGRINERLRGMTDEQIRAQELPLHQELQRLVEDLPHAQHGCVTDGAGFPLLATNLYPVRHELPMADRDYLAALKGPTPPETYIGRPFLQPDGNQLLFDIARRRRETGNSDVLPDGFDGVVRVSIRPDVLAESMRRLSAAPGDVLALIREDGQILSRTTGQDGILPPIPPGRPFHAAVASGTASAAYETVGLAGGTAWVAALRRLDGFPVYAVSLRPRSAVMAHWRRSVATQLIFGIPATLALLLLAMRVRRDQLRLGLTNASLESEVERSADRLDRAGRLGLVATFEIDLHSGVNRRSAEYMSLQGYQASPAEEQHADWVRRLHPDDRDRAEAVFLEAVSDASGITEYSQSYRIMTHTGGIRWIAARGDIERDAQGRALVMRGAHVDVTPLRTTELALAESDARLRLAQEAAGIGTWEWVPATRALTWSRKMIELWGFDPAEGQPGLAATVARLHPDDRGRVRRQMAISQRTGHFRSEFRILRPSADGEPETVWVTARARRLPFEAGPEPRLMGVAYDITERKLAEENATLLAHEVEHRAKNVLAVVAGLLRVTKAANQEAYIEVMEGRVQALARTLTLLSQYRWKGASLRELVAHEMEPFSTGSGLGIVLSGPHVLVEAAMAQPLSMALHELATNAAKYGSLSVPTGRLEIGWWVEDETVHLVWRELGGPRLEGPPARLSFGSQLIRQTFENQLGGAMNKSWDPSGLVCTVSFPLRAG